MSDHKKKQKRNQNNLNKYHETVSRPPWINMCVYKYLITGFIELYLKKANPYNIHISTGLLVILGYHSVPFLNVLQSYIVHWNRPISIIWICIWAVDIFSQYTISLVMKHKKSYVKKQRREPLIANADEIIWN